MLSLSQQKKNVLERQKIVANQPRNAREREAAARARKKQESERGDNESDNEVAVYDMENDNLEKMTSIDTRASSHDNALIKHARQHEKKLHDGIIEDRVEDGETLVAPEWFINPKDPRKIYWDLVLGVLIIASVIEVPWRIALDEPAIGGWVVWGIFIDIMFFLDIVANFRTGWINLDGEIVWDWRVIRNKYLAGWFLVDFLSTVPFDKIIVPVLEGSADNNSNIAVW